MDTRSRRIIIEVAPAPDWGWWADVTFIGDDGEPRPVGHPSDLPHATWQLAMERAAWVVATEAGAAPRFRRDGTTQARWTLTADDGGVTTSEWT